MKDFKPITEHLSLHGLGFIQMVLPDNARLHIWHPDLPRRKCFEHSAIHNHRFSFLSTVLVGTQVNQRATIEVVKEGTGEARIISHDGPRSPMGGRISEEIGDCNIHLGAIETYHQGEHYYMSALEYHQTPNSGIVVTYMRKTDEGAIHANSICRKGATFDQSFDRFQLPQDALWEYVKLALEGTQHGV